MRKEEALRLELEACFEMMKRDLLRRFKKERAKIDGYFFDGYLDWNYEEGNPKIKTRADLKKRNLKRYAFLIEVNKNSMKGMRRKKP